MKRAGRGDATEINLLREGNVKAKRGRRSRPPSLSRVRIHGDLETEVAEFCRVFVANF